MTEEKYVDVDGIKTRYFEKDSGPLVVLFHGGHFGSQDTADCAEDWSLNFDGLAERFHVFAVDKIGQGFTDNPKQSAAVVRPGFTREKLQSPEPFRVVTKNFALHLFVNVGPLAHD